MRRIMLALAIMAGLGPSAVMACTAYLVGERVVDVGRNGYTRKLRFCYYDHMGDPMMTTVSAANLCSLTLNVRHDNEDRDGDGKEDDEEGNGE